MVDRETERSGARPAETVHVASASPYDVTIGRGVTATVAAELLELGIVLNTVNPGPVDTGYLTPDATDRPLGEIQDLIDSTPFGRFGAPSDPANLIGWLATDDGAWIVGQVLTSDGGFYLA